MKLKGPGWVFIESSGKNKTMALSPNRRNDFLSIALLFLLLVTILSLEMLIKI